MLKLNQLFLKMKVNTCIDKPEAEFEKVLVIFIFVYVTQHYTCVDIT